MTSIDTFIISWAGHHSNAEHIAACASNSSTHVTIVYSDPNPAFSIDPKFNALRRSNELFFGDKLQACLEHSRSDVLLLIHADCLCDSWSAVVTKCREAFDAFPEIAVWAPNIDKTSYELQFTEVRPLPNSDLSAVVQTDAIVLAIRRSVVNRLKKSSLEKNLYGWGTDWMVICDAYVNNSIAVVDRSIAVHHPPARGYSSAPAKEQMLAFFDQFSVPEKVMHDVLDGFMRSKKPKLQKIAKKKKKRRFKFW